MRLLLFSFSLRVFYLLIKGVERYADSEEYLHLGESILRGEYTLYGVTTLRRAPLYALFTILTSPVLIALAQCVLDAATTVIIYKIVEKAVSKPYAVVAGLFYALHPGAIMYTNNILSETLFTFLLTLSFYLAINEDIKSGVATALGILCRPLGVIYALPLLVYTKKKIAFCLILTLIVGVWLVRCYTVAGSFVFVHSPSAAQFYVPTRTDLYGLHEAELWQALKTDSYFLSVNGSAPEVAKADKKGFAMGLKNIAANPSDYVIQRVKSYPYLFLSSFDQFSGASSWKTGFWIKIPLLIIFSLIPLGLSFFGIRHNKVTLLCASVWILTMIVHLPLWIEYRFWIPALPFQVVSATVGLYKLIEKI